MAQLGIAREVRIFHLRPHHSGLYSGKGGAGAQQRAETQGAAELGRGRAGLALLVGDEIEDVTGSAIEDAAKLIKGLEIYAPSTAIDKTSNDR